MHICPLKNIDLLYISTFFPNPPPLKNDKLKKQRTPGPLLPSGKQKQRGGRRGRRAGREEGEGEEYTQKYNKRLGGGLGYFWECTEMRSTDTHSWGHPCALSWGWGWLWADEPEPAGRPTAGRRHVHSTRDGVCGGHKFT